MAIHAKKEGELLRDEMAVSFETKEPVALQMRHPVKLWSVLTEE